MVVAVFAGAAAVFNDDAFVVIVDVERDEAVVFAAALRDGDDDAGCSADPCSGDDVGSYSVCLAARDSSKVMFCRACGFPVRVWTP